MLNLKKKLRKQRNNFQIVLSVLILSLYSYSNAISAEDFWLVSPEEFIELGASEPDTYQPLSSVNSNGPVIELMQPNIAEQVTTPIDIVINFLPGASQAQPNMKSLIIALKGIITIDITKRLEPFINGTTLNVQDAKIPKGKHRILVMIQDQQENYSERLIKIKVN